MNYDFKANFYCGIIILKIDKSFLQSNFFIYITLAYYRICQPKIQKKNMLKTVKISIFIYNYIFQGIKKGRFHSKKEFIRKGKLEMF